MTLIVGRAHCAGSTWAEMSCQATARRVPPPEVARYPAIAPTSRTSTAAPANRALVLVDVDRLAVGLGDVETLDHEVRDPDAAVRGGVGRHGRVAVDRVAAGEVHR